MNSGALRVQEQSPGAGAGVTGPDMGVWNRI